MTENESAAFTKSQAPLACANKAGLYHADMTLGSRIKQARRAKGMTQAELGRHFGISSQAVSQWENDPTKGPQRDKMGKLAVVLDVDLIWLSGNPADDISPSVEITRLIEGMPDKLQRQALRLIRALAEDGSEAA